MDTTLPSLLTNRSLLDAEAWPDTQPAMYRSEGFAEDLDLPVLLSFELKPGGGEPLARPED